MLSTLRPLLLLLPLSIVVGQDDGPVPTHEFELVVDGVTHLVELDTEVGVKIGGKERRVVLRAKPYQKFEYGGISFHAPADAAYTYDGVNPPSYEFDLPDASLMLMEYVGVSLEEAHEFAVQGVLDNYAEDEFDVEESEVTREFGGTEMEGVRLEVDWDEDFLMIQELYVFGVGERAFMLMIQDLRDDPEVETDDAERIYELLESSFETQDD